MLLPVIEPVRHVVSFTLGCTRSVGDDRCHMETLAAELARNGGRHGARVVTMRPGARTRGAGLEVHLSIWTWCHIPMPSGLAWWLAIWTWERRDAHRRVRGRA